MRRTVVALMIIGLAGGVACGKKKEAEAEKQARTTKGESPGWVAAAAALEKAGCACKDAACARRQQRALRAFIKRSKGATVDRTTSNLVSESVRNAQRCISKVMLGEKLKRLE